MPNVAILGASADRKKFGNKSVRAHLRAGWQVFPVHPSATQIEAIPAHRTVLDIPVVPLHRVSFYLPASIALSVLDEVAQVRPGEVWLNPGADAPEVVAKANSLGLNVIRGCSIVDVGYSPSDFPEN